MNDTIRQENSDSVPQDGSYDEWGDRRDYRVINGWSVVAMILALLSSAALLLPIFWGVPLLAIIVSLVALSKIKREPHLYMGRRLAIVSLVAALILGGWSTSRHYFFRLHMYAAAENNLNNWFELIKQGKQEEVHQLSLLPGMRAMGKTTLSEYYQNEKRVRQEMQKFFSGSPMRQIIKLGPGSSLRLIQNRNVRITDDAGLLVYQRFMIEYSQDGQPVALPVEIKSSRIFDKYTRSSHWTVLTVQNLQ